jgi:hypothetical protein
LQDLSFSSTGKSLDEKELNQSILVQGVGFELSDPWSYRPQIPSFSICLRGQLDLGLLLSLIARVF